jgi:hypothetical protein
VNFKEVEESKILLAKEMQKDIFSHRKNTSKEENNEINC